MFLSEYYSRGYDNSNKIHLVQDIYNKKFKKLSTRVGQTKPDERK